MPAARMNAESSQRNRALAGEAEAWAGRCGSGVVGGKENGASPGEGEGVSVAAVSGMRGIR